MNSKEKKDVNVQGTNNPEGKKKENAKFVKDQQTGNLFYYHEEELFDTIAARCSIIYLLIMAFFFLWQLFDIWVNEFTLIKLVYCDVEVLKSSKNFHIVVYTFLGGALGGIVGGIRSFIFWHCDHKGFGRRYIWKSLSAPWLGAILALFVFALIRTSVTIVGGDFDVPTDGGKNINQILSMFALGVISGFGYHNVFLWLDSHVNKIFKITPQKDADEVEVPDLINLTKEEAEKKLSGLGLKLETVNKETQDVTLHGKIIEQTPSAKTNVKKETVCKVSIAVKP